MSAFLALLIVWATCGMAAVAVMLWHRRRYLCPDDSHVVVAAAFCVLAGPAALLMGLIATWQWWRDQR